MPENRVTRALVLVNLKICFFLSISTKFNLKTLFISGRTQCKLLSSLYACVLHSARALLQYSTYNNNNNNNNNNDDDDDDDIRENIFTNITRY